MEQFWADGWNHIIFSVEEPYAGEKRPLIRWLCFGPAETIEYGITNDKLYFEDNILEGLDEGDCIFQIIDKEHFLKIAENELRLCEKFAPQLSGRVAEQLSDICDKFKIGKITLSNFTS